ncbi:hypothetical protein [Candidatus Nitrosopumilus sediminis]|uniref:Uncharacterized protein n=1 Tax=Candidatus Nitrosopumilus sediminis TaxID=1229909 RepID=K0BBY9_9ARCH|nr:hypothetical protein [Candidatus Nitrosopumilus sediminis]AFS82510.1 hypothetical protein NSED_03520 [Candidatus Nitrosopumilus sediminis]
MRTSLKLFLIGLSISFIISISEIFALEELPKDPEEYLVYTISFTTPYVRLLYYSLLVAVIPMIAIPQLDEKVSKRVHYVYIFLSGITFGFSIVGVYTVLTQRILV